MESVMVCFSAKMTKQKVVSIFDYSVKSSDNLFQLSWVPSGNGLVPYFQLFNNGK